ncbi:MAG: hypothetical protein ACRDWY_18655 [Actinomycetes bacterium]
MDRTARTALTALTTGALLLAAAAPARADVEAFPDRRSDTSHPADVVKVRVEHTDRVVVAVHHDNLTFHDGPGYLRIAYDTGPRYEGPEFYLRIWYQTDRPIDLRRAEGWGTLHAGPIASCTGETADVSARRNVTSVGVPRACFGNPPRVRVHVRLRPFPRDDRKVDVAPASRTMGPWVRR